MHWRRWLGLLAVLGVLLHAGAVVRHNAVVLAAASRATSGVAADRALAADLRLICGAAAHMAEAMLPGGNGPAGDPEKCPICAGLASAHALAAVEQPTLAVPYGDHAITIATDDQRVSIQRRYRPPSRAPPTLA